MRVPIIGGSAAVVGSVSTAIGAAISATASLVAGIFTLGIGALIGTVVGTVIGDWLGSLFGGEMLGSGWGGSSLTLSAGSYQYSNNGAGGGGDGGSHYIAYSGQLATGTHSLIRDVIGMMGAHIDGQSSMSISFSIYKDPGYNDSEPNGVLHINASGRNAAGQTVTRGEIVGHIDGSAMGAEGLIVGVAMWALRNTSLAGADPYALAAVMQQANYGTVKQIATEIALARAFGAIEMRAANDNHSTPRRIAA